ncbi:MAG TPA: tRNA 2-thiouridine(34) synthase MnmA, partial [Anaerovoracaceae bacterium]|nr:tRNA 2-thiouridine(34) synthase MnmA [Anaerovoracaceae bacterium]
MNKKVMVAMSGGVDSTVAAYILFDQGYEVCGATLKLYDNDDLAIDDTTRTCCSLADVEDAKIAAGRLGLRHYVFNFGLHFRRDVMERFSNAYQEGETPNPCIDCNRYIKFSKLLERAMILGNDYIATGHYAKIEYDKESCRHLLKRSKDVTKDQTYVLYAMTQFELSRTLFPLGDMVKSEVRQLAETRGLINAEKPDSQDICFVKDGNYAEFLTNAMGVKSRPGSFVDKEGAPIGRHKGVIHYTLGQRRGLNISMGKRKYVTGINVEDNTVTLGEDEDLMRNSLMARDVNLISVDQLKEPMAVTAKIRYSAKESPATI